MACGVRSYTMRKAFKYRIYPNVNQKRELEIMLETHRRLYNECLGQRKDAYETSQKSIKYTEQSAWFKAERSSNGYYAQLNFSSAQATMRRLQRSFENFFRRVKSGEKPGYPRFKGYGRFTSWTYPAVGDGCRLFDSGKLRLQNIGMVKVKLHRPWQGEIKTLSIKQEADHWYVIASCDVGDAPEPRAEQTTVAIDVGIEHFLSTDDGQHVSNPTYLKQSLKKLRVTGRSVSRKKKGGSNRRKAVHQLQKVHRKVANQRRDFHHKEASKLVQRYAYIAAESLNIKSMVRNSRLSRSISDAGWNQFLGILRSKAEEAGSVFVDVDPKHTSQDCSECGARVHKKLSVRWHKCPNCGLKLQRDVNAARNILAKARYEPLKHNVRHQA